MNARGFSLTELIVVIGLISTLVAISTISFNSWQKKYNIEAQVKEMLVDLDGVRLSAIQTKKQHTVVLNPTSYTVWRYSSEADLVGTQVFSKSLKYPIQQFSKGALSDFSNPKIAFDDRGYTTNLLTIAVGAGLADPAYNCLGIHNARVNMGKITGDNCVF
ncbi:Tfp pilus assembly protein FimT/FimU [Geobacter sp. SVR]|uniref:pilus assembly FimT family protein n=1 Tax=Geobacter sp. SVR TaxID=2495594 RepID=UPI00143F0327|nr:prepilin-type N-terminal cleavage/methylation domain-containing protein [Geobacter sp. SVR]BCS53483.1 hypothetical protein GSVR_17910 [Geobacter sp. SVR]GCF85390.1 type IV pilus minor pilin FimU [Geobacter sp. SVR]